MLLLLLLLLALPPNEDAFEKESTCKSEEEEREEAMIFSRFVLFSLLFVLSFRVVVCLFEERSLLRRSFPPPRCVLFSEEEF